MAVAFVCSLAIFATLGGGATARGAAAHSSGVAQLRVAPAANKTSGMRGTPRRPFGSASLPWSLVKLANECQCQFEGECTCKSALAFMDCIAKACTSAVCQCKKSQYQESCLALGSSCEGALHLQCMPSSVSCSMEASIAETTTTTLPLETEESVLAELEGLRKRKCELIKAIEDGWLNADNRLRELEPVIENRLQRLAELGGSAPYMGCDAAHAPIETTSDDSGDKAGGDGDGDGHKAHEAKSGVSGCSVALLGVAALAYVVV